MIFKRREAKHRARSQVVVAIPALCLAACGAGASAPADVAPADSVSITDGDAAGAPATFTAVYTEVLGPTCSTCHRPGGIGSFQDFSSRAAAYGALVRAKASGPSCGSNGETRVVPGNASGSLLFQKISDPSPPCGAMMPLGGPPLPSAQVTWIEDWINAGAQND
jgi:cytochrome c5